MRSSWLCADSNHLALPGKSHWPTSLMATVALVIGMTTQPLLAAEPAATLAATSTIGQSRVRLSGSVDDGDRVTLTKQRHPSLDKAEDLGPADDTLVVQHMILVLRADTSQEQALQRHLNALQEPGSKSQGPWLTPVEFEQQYGVAPQDRQVVVDWLGQHGFTIDELPTGGRSIVFSGTVASIRAAFGTDMHHYNVGGQRHLANHSDPSIPDALSPVIGGVLSLHDFRSRPMRPPAQVLPTFTSGSTHALSPADYRTIYNLNSLAAQGVDGTGRSIAILGRTDVVLADMQAFRSAMGLPAKDPVIVYNGSNPGRQSGDEGESDLDLQWAGAVAPGATVKFITSASTSTTDGISLSAQFAVSQNVADVISLSYGMCEADLGSTALSFYNSLWQQAAIQGMSVFVSSGDSGAADCDAGKTTATRGRTVNGLCTSPYATCVGGTQFNDVASPSTYWSASNNNSGSALSYIPEVVWNESGSVSGGSGLWASGGGTSTVFALPTWQTGNGVPTGSFRSVPDVSLAAASHDGYLVYSSDNTTSTRTLYTFGGTSASAPSFAGLMALVNQKATTRQGNANPRLYQLAALQAGGGPAYFQRVTGGNNSVPGVTGFAASTSTITPTYNQATGWGSVDGDVLVNHWGDVLASTSTSLSVSPTAITYSQPVTFTASVSGNAPTGTVQFKDGGVNLGSPVALSNGTAALNTSSLTTGSHSITAVYSGDIANNISSAGALAFMVNQVISAVSLSPSSATSTLGQTVTLTATLGGKSVTGSLLFLDGGVPLATVVIASCPTVYSTAALGAGEHNLSVQYLGDVNNTISTSAVVLHTVSVPLISTGTSVSGTPSGGIAGTSLTFTAQVSGQSPTGSVQFKDGNTPLGGAVALNGGSAQFATNQLGAGTYSITAVYSGDSANAASTSAPLSLTLGAASPSVVLSSPNGNAAVGQSVQLNANVSGFAPTGTVIFREGSIVLYNTSLVNGLASFSTSALAAGSHTLTSDYSGDSNNVRATSAPFVITVSVAGDSNADVPALPWWGSGLLAFTLLVSLARRSRWRLASVAPLVLLSSLALFMPQTARSAVLAGWDFSALPGGSNAFGASPLAASMADASVDVSGLTRGTGVGTTGTAAARGWGGTSWTASSAASAVAANTFVTFSMSAKSGYLLSLSSISRIDYRRSSSGATAGVLQVQVGSGTFSDVTSFSYSSTSSSGASLPAVDLTGVPSLQNVPAGTVVTFRIVNYGASSANGSWYLFDVAKSTAADLEISGSTAPAGPPVTGACGNSAGKTFATAPASNLCSAGTPSGVNQGSSWNWTCGGSNGGATTSCSAVDSSAAGC